MLEFLKYLPNYTTCLLKGFITLVSQNRGNTNLIKYT